MTDSTPAPHKPSISEREKRIVREMTEDGHSQAEIQQRIGRSQSTVSRLQRELEKQKND